jgi:hypothetical protein
MTPIEGLSESSFYQCRRVGVEGLGRRVGDPDKSHRLCHELDEIPDTETLRRKLAALAERENQF